MEENVIIKVTLIDGALHVETGGEGISPMQLLGIFEKIKFDILNDLDAYNQAVSSGKKYDA